LGGLQLLYYILHKCGVGDRQTAHP